MDKVIIKRARAVSLGQLEFEIKHFMKKLDEEMSSKEPHLREITHCIGILHEILDELTVKLGYEELVSRSYGHLARMWTLFDKATK